jgi:hypothetical protein
MSGLGDWLQEATRHLSRESAAQVRAEIREHFESAREAAIAGGVASEDAERQALLALGDARKANCQYRRVLLTSREARMLREGAWEARAVCAHGWLKGFAMALPGVLMAVAGILFAAGRGPVARDVLVCGVGTSPMAAALLLPINTPLRGLVYRCAKWVAMIVAVELLFGPNAMKWSWMLVGCMWPSLWSEWTRASIRRKLPVKAWPRHLYL